MGEYINTVKAKRISEKKIFVATFLVSALGILLWGKEAVINSPLPDVRSFADLGAETYKTSALLAYVLRERWWPIPLMFVMSTTYLGNITGYLISAWYGMGIGVVLGTMLLRYGIKGIFVMLGASVPQYLFYVAAFGFSLKLLKQRRVVNKSMVVQLIVMETIVILGCVSETMIAPVMMKKIIKIL